MRQIDVRRHSVRDLPQEALSIKGVELARSEGARSGPFERVVTSPVLRAVQTAASMGFPSQTRDPLWAAFGNEVRLKQVWPASFSQVRAMMELDSATRSSATLLLRSLEGIAGGLSDSGRALVVTHGGFPELVAVAAFPDQDPAPWGGVLRCMEGIRIRLRRSSFDTVEVLRVPDELTRV